MGYFSTCIIFIIVSWRKLDFACSFSNYWSYVNEIKPMYVFKNETIHGDYFDVGLKTERILDICDTLFLNSAILKLA